MRPTYVPVIACVLLFQFLMPELHVACAEEPTAQKEIETAIGQFFSSMSKRDVKALQAVLYAPRFVGIEAAGQQAQAHVIHTDKPEELLPPEGNDDWDNVRISDVKVQTSTTHPSVAVASFTLEFPLDAKTVARYKKMLEANPAELGEAKKKAFSKIVDDGALKTTMFAMFGRQLRKWKIVCITLPK